MKNVDFLDIKDEPKFVKHVCDGLDKVTGEPYKGEKNG